MSSVYVIRGAGGFVKIGLTRDVGSRLRELQIASPVRLELLTVRPGGIADERALHHRFRARRVSGEWFALSDDEVEMLKTEFGHNAKITYLPKVHRPRRR